MPHPLEGMGYYNGEAEKSVLQRANDQQVLKKKKFVGQKCMLTA